MVDHHCIPTQTAAGSIDLRVAGSQVAAARTYVRPPPGDVTVTYIMNADALSPGEEPRPGARRR